MRIPRETNVAAVANLFRAKLRGAPMERMAEARLVQDHGVEDCGHARPGGKRQILLVDRETLDAMGLRPGLLRENITTAGLNVNGLVPGERLRIGRALLEVTGVCTPCDQMEKIRTGLRRELWGRRGMLCRVIEGGLIKVGASIEKCALLERGASG